MILRGLYLLGRLGSRRPRIPDKKKVPRLFYAFKSEMPKNIPPLELGQIKVNNYLTRIKIIKEMKKIFLMALSVFLFLTTASFAGNDDNSNKVANEIEVSIEKAVPTYWEGWANDTGSKKVYLKVYQTPGQCNSYAADIYYLEYGEYVKKGEAWVKENPNYDSSCMYTNSRCRKYYITYGGTNYYFNM